MTGRGGFTLTELLVAVFIFALGIVGVLALFASAMQTSRIATEETDVSLLASSVAAELRSELEAGGKLSERPAQRHPDYPDYEYAVTAVQLDEDGQEYFVEITVTWRRKGREVSERFRTIILRKQ